MTLQQIVDAVGVIAKEVEETRPAPARLVELLSDIARLSGELERAKGLLGPLVPNAANPKTPDEETAAYLGQRLRSLATIARARADLES